MRPKSGSCRRTQHEEHSRTVKSDKKSSKTELTSGRKLSSKNVHFTPTKDSSKNLSRSEDQRFYSKSNEVLTLYIQVIVFHGSIYLPWKLKMQQKKNLLH